MTLLSDPAHSSQLGVHALVIGVGVYPHLLNGTGAPFKHPSGMGQLDSPPHSALAFTKWLQGSMSLKGNPLRSLEVLTSHGIQFTDYSGNQVSVEEPTMKNIEDAVSRWFTAANSHKDNLSVVYFCGHGFTVGEITALLTQDYGESIIDPFRATVDPSAFVSGMLRCAAERQLFIFDACRTVNHAFVYEFGGNISPRPLIGGTDHQRLGVVQRSVIHSTRLGVEAYGQPGNPSIFMECFLRAMTGAGATQNNLAKWIIEPTSLKAGVDWLMQQKLRRDHQCLTFGNNDAADFPIHELVDIPVVPIMVVCEPEPHLERSLLSCSSGHTRLDPTYEPWVFDLPMGNYKFEATDVESGKKSLSDPFQNRPPKLVVNIVCGD